MPILRIRPSNPADAEELARLIDIAGEGIPTWLWSQVAEKGEPALDIGAQRARRTEGGFSHRNAHVADMGGHVAGMLLGYKQADVMDPGDLSGLPDVIAPLVELESLAPGSWYVNAIAVFDVLRGEGVGTQLMELAEDLATRTNSQGLSLIVAEANTGARRLYERLGYVERARRPIVPFEGFAHQDGDWILMVKA